MTPLILMKRGTAAFIIFTFTLTQVLPSGFAEAVLTTQEPGNTNVPVMTIEQAQEKTESESDMGETLPPLSEHEVFFTESSLTGVEEEVALDPDASLPENLSHIIDINGKKVSVDMKALVDQIKSAQHEAANQHSAETGQYPIEGYGMESLLFLKGVEELFTKEEVMGFLTVPSACLDGRAPCLYSSAPPQYTDQDWNNFTTELLRRMDRKGQDILHSINYFAQTDGPAFAVVIEKVIELVKNGLEDPNAKKWEEVKTLMGEISGQVAEIKRLLSEYEPLKKQRDELSREFSGLNEIMEGKKSLLLYSLLMIQMNYEILLPRLEGFMSRLEEAVQSGSLEKAETILKEYRAMTGNDSDYVPSFEATVEQLLELTASAKSGIAELPGLIEGLKAKIAERSKLWEEQAIAVLKGLDAVAGVQMAEAGSGYWVYGDVWPPYYAYPHLNYYTIRPLPFPYFQTWVESRFLKVILKDGAELKVESRNGVIDPLRMEKLRNYPIYPGVIEINGKKVSVEMKRLIELVSQAAYEASSELICVGGWPCSTATQLFQLPGVKELFSLEELKGFETRSDIYPEGSVFTTNGWIDFTTELLRRMDAKGQEILAPINYLVDPGPDAPMFSVLHEKVMELVRNGLEDPNAKKWEEVKAVMVEISAQIEKLKELRKRLESIASQSVEMEQEYHRLNEILNGKPLWLPLHENVIMPVEIYAGDWMLIQFLESIQARLLEAVNQKDLAKAANVLEEYRSGKSSTYAYIPPFDLVVTELQKMIDVALKRLEELPGLIKDLKIKITERSKVWEEQAMAALKGFEAVANVEFAGAGSGYWIYGEVWPLNYAYPQVMDYYMIRPFPYFQTWVEPSFFKVTLKDGTELKIESRNGEIDPEAIETLRNIYPSVIDLNGKKVSVEMKALIDAIHKASMEASSDIVCVGGWACATKILLLQLPGVKELFSEEELGKFETRAEYPGGTFTQKGWIDFTTELLRRMDAKGQEILAPISYLVDPGPDAPMFSVLHEKVMELVKNGLEDSNAEKWEQIRNAINQIAGHIDTINLFVRQYNAINAEKAGMEADYKNLEEILNGKFEFLMATVQVMPFYMILMSEIRGFFDRFQEASKDQDLEEAMNVLKDYEAMLSDESDAIPTFDQAIEQLIQWTDAAKERALQLPGLIEKLKGKIAERSKMWEEQAMAALDGFDIVAAFEMLPPGGGYWNPGPYFWPLPLGSIYPAVDYFYDVWVEPRFFQVTLKDGTELKIEFRNGQMDPDMIYELENHLIYPGVIEMNGKKVSVDMKALVDQIKAARSEAERRRIDETGQHPIEGFGMESLLFLSGVSELFTQDEIGGFLTVPVCLPGALCVQSSAPPQYTDQNWIDFTTELLRRMDAKGQEILAPINYLVDPGPDAPMFSVLNEKVIDLVKNGLQDPDTKKWDTVRNALSEIDSQLERLKALKAEKDAANQKADSLQKEHDELNQVLDGKRSTLMVNPITMMVYWPHQRLIDQLMKYQDSLNHAIEEGNLEGALNVVGAYEAMKNDQNDITPDFDAAVAEILKLTAWAQERLKSLPELIRALKEKIAARSREWEAQALAQFQKYGDIIKDVTMTAEKGGGWVKNPDSYCDKTTGLCVDYAQGQHWVEKRYFAITFSDGTVIRGSSENGNLDRDTIAKLEEKRKELSQPKPSEPPLVKSLPPSPAAVGFFAPVFRAPFAKVFGGIIKTAAKIFRTPLAALSR